MAKKRGKKLTSASRRALAYQLALNSPVFEALVRGLFNIISRRAPARGRRILEHLDRLIREYRYRALEDRTKAAVWLISELSCLNIPDPRTTRAPSREVRLITQFDALLRAVKPVFRERYPDARRRNDKLAPIVSVIIGHEIKKDALPAASSAAEFCREVLHTNEVQLSRSRRRVARYGASQVWRLRSHLTLLAKVSGRQHSSEIANLKKTSHLISQRLRQLAPRHARSSPREILIKK